MSWFDEPWNPDSNEGRSQVMKFLEVVGDEPIDAQTSDVRPKPEWFWIERIFISTRDEGDDATVEKQEHEALKCGPSDARCIRLPSRREGVGWGSGLHPATQLLCCWLQRSAVRGLMGKNVRLCDYGSGSGILALTACTVCEEVAAFGVDIEPTAVEGANQNAVANGIDGRCKFYLPSRSVLNEDESFLERFGDVRGLSARPLPEDACPFDIVISNLWPHVQCAMAATVAAMLKPGGLLAVGGLQDNRADEVIQAYRNAGVSLQVDSRDRRGGGWALLSNLASPK